MNTIRILASSTISTSIPGLIITNINGSDPVVGVIPHFFKGLHYLDIFPRAFKT